MDILEFLKPWTEEQELIFFEAVGIQIIRLETRRMTQKNKPFVNLVPVQEIGRLLKQAVYDSCITCGGCETNLEADCDICGICGWENPLVKFGYI
ncbi:unnamed protein product [marine sediment metagenome]|uniref:Uncharacterized protein n=1 Tax=marine sediment metagenome TaxID=412755 RepID=X1NRE7_9ZZZZ